MSHAFDLRASIRGVEKRSAALIRDVFAKKMYMLALFFLIAASGCALLRLAALSPQMKTLEENRLAIEKKKSAAYENVESISEKIGIYAEKLDFAQSSTSLYEFLAALAGGEEEDVSLLQLNCTEKSVTITGCAQSEAAVLAFVERVGLFVSVLRTDVPEIYDMPDAPSAPKGFTLRCILR